MKGKMINSKEKESTMTTTARTDSDLYVKGESAIDQIDRKVVISIGVVAALIGLWAAASLTSAVVAYGIGPVARGFISAVRGL